MLKLKVRRVFASYISLMLQTSRIFVYRLLSNNSIHGSPKRLQPIQVVGKGKITCGAHVSIGVPSSPYFFSTYAYIEARKPASIITIGEGTCINNNFSAISESSIITIGCCCLIGTNVEIFDSDFHVQNIADRQSGRRAESEPVTIGNDVFIGSNVKIMKGVTIGNGSVIANGSIVTKDVPCFTVAAGNPAKTIRVID